MGYEMKKTLTLLLFALVLVTSFVSAAALITSYWGNGTDYLEVDQGDNAQFLIWASSTIDYVEYGAVLLQNGNYVETIVEGSVDGGPYGTDYVGWHNVDTLDLDGVYVLSVYASDGEDGYDAVELTLNVNVEEEEPEEPTNNAPVIDPIVPQSAQCGNLFELPIYANDADDDDLTYSDNTDLFNINQNGLISFTPSCNDVGIYNIIITVSDGDLEDTEDFSLVIYEANGGSNNEPFVPSNPIPADGAEKVPRLNIFFAWSGGDPDGDRVTYRFYLGTGPGIWDLIDGAETTSSTYMVDYLSYDTEYYWRVVANDGEDEVVGPVWTFTTVEGPEDPEEPEDDDEDDGNSNDSGDDESFGFEEVLNYGDCVDDGDGDEYGFRSVTRTLIEFTTGYTVNSYMTEEVCYLGYNPDIYYPYDEDSFGLSLLVALIFLAITIPIAVYAYNKLS